MSLYVRQERIPRITVTVESYSISLCSLTCTGLVVRPEEVLRVTVAVEGSRFIDTALLTPVCALPTLVNV